VIPETISLPAVEALCAFLRGQEPLRHPESYLSDKPRRNATTPYSLLRSDFCIALNQLIEKHGLDWDPHSFARLPEKPLIKWQSREYIGVEVFPWIDDLPEHTNPLTDLPTIKGRDGIKEGDLLIVGPLR